MIARWLCWLLGHEAVLVSGRTTWACRRCRQVWPLLVLALVLCGCRPAASPLSPDDLADLRTWSSAGHELADASAALCPSTARPALCTSALADVSATLADADTILGAVDACQGPDAATCQQEAGAAAVRVGPRLAARLARLVLLVQGAR